MKEVTEAMVVEPEAVGGSVDMEVGLEEPVDEVGCLEYKHCT